MKEVPAGRDVVNVIPASEVERGGLHRPTPCEKCPWRKDATGIFSPEAFKVSANTCYPGSRTVFACHSSKTAKPHICAGFMLNGVGLHGAIYETPPDCSDMGLDLHPTYFAMAVANGVDPEDPILEPLPRS